jgi:hypothetical protein
MNWSNIFNNNFGRTNYGFGNAGWSGNNYGTFEKGGYGGNAVTLPNLNTQSTMNTTGTSFMSNNNSGGWGFNNGNQYQSNQPYNDFLRYSINPGQERLAQARERRTFVTNNVIGPLAQAGFWQPWPNYPLNLYNV